MPQYPLDCVEVGVAQSFCFWTGDTVLLLRDVHSSSLLARPARTENIAVVICLSWLGCPAMVSHPTPEVLMKIAQLLAQIGNGYVAFPHTPPYPTQPHPRPGNCMFLALVSLSVGNLINPQQLELHGTWSPLKFPPRNWVWVKCEFYVVQPGCCIHFWGLEQQTSKTNLRQGTPRAVLVLVLVLVTGAVNFNYAPTVEQSLLPRWQRGGSSQFRHLWGSQRVPSIPSPHTHPLTHRQIAIKWAWAWLKINDNGVSVAMCGKWLVSVEMENEASNRFEVQSNETN